MQDVAHMLEERNRAEQAQGFLDDANAQLDRLEQQMGGMSLRMRKLATGLHLALEPQHQVGPDLCQQCSRLIC